MNRIIYTKKIVAISIMFIFMIGIVGNIGSATLPLTTTELTISSIKGGFGKIILEVQNIGDVVAEDIELQIKATGGFLKRINIEKICTGCSDCGSTIDPGASRSESTAEEKIIFGFGSLKVQVSANASNAEKVEDTVNGFIIGFFVIIAA